jgi:Membrane protein of unknown function (DUF340).
MFNVLIFLALGIGAGLLIRNKSKVLPYIEKTTGYVIYLLLITLGIKAGADKTITSQIHTLGLTALIITAFTVSGSVLVVWLTYHVVFKSKQGEK